MTMRQPLHWYRILAALARSLLAAGCSRSPARTSCWGSIWAFRSRPFWRRSPGTSPALVAVIAISGWAHIGRFAIFPAISTALVAAMLAVGLAISVSSRTAVQAQGRAIFLWFAFVLLYDLLLMGTLVTADLSPGLLVSLLLLNPVDSARILAVLVLEPDLHLLGPAGAFLMGAAGRGGTALLLLASLLAWTGIPLLTALMMFRIPRARALPVERENGEPATATPIPSTE